MSKRLLSIMLAMLMLFSLLPMSAMAIGDEETGNQSVERDSGSTVGSNRIGGSETFWSYDESKKTLTISGEGMVPGGTGKGGDTHPWDDYEDEITKLVIVQGVTGTLGSKAFAGMNALTEIQFPNSFTTIGGGAFANCSNLKTVTLPATVETLSSVAFSNCNALELLCVLNKNISVTDDAKWSTNSRLPDNLTVYGYQYTDDNTNHTALYNFIQRENGKLSSGEYKGSPITFIAYDDPDNASGVVDGTSITWKYTAGTRTLTISGSGDVRFVRGEDGSDTPWYQYRDLIEKVVFKEGVTGVSTTKAFAEMPKLSEIVFPESLKTLGTGIFASNPSLESVTLPDTLESMAGVVFSNCMNLKSLTIENPELEVPESSMWSSDAVPGCVAPDGLIVYGNKWTDSTTTQFYQYVQYNNEHGSNILFVALDEQKQIKDSNLSWSYDESTKTLSITGNGSLSVGETSIPWNKHKSEIETIVFGEGVTGSTATKTFAGMDSLKTIVFSSTFTNLSGSGTFANNPSLEYVRLPETIEKLGSVVFSGTNNLKVLRVDNPDLDVNTSQWASDAMNRLPDALTVYGYSKDGTTDIYEFVKYQNEYAGYTNDITFVAIDDPNATAGVIGDSNTFWSYDAGTKTLTITGEGYVPGMQNHNVPWSKYKDKIETLEIAEGITGTEGYKAFSDLYALKEINFPSSFISLGHGTFANCLALEKVTLPETIEYLSSVVFSNCDSLKELRVENRNIDVSCVIDGKLDDGDEEDISTTWSTTGTTPKGLKVYGYENTPKGGNEKTEIYTYITGNRIEFVDLDSYAGDIGENLSWTFDGDTLTISGDGEIPDYNDGQTPWSDYNSQIKHIVVEKGIIAIGANAFSGVTDLTSAKIDRTVEKIDDSAFNTEASFTIEAKRGSAALEYANAHNIETDEIVTANILFIGNSYTEDAREYLRYVFDQYSFGADVKFGHLYSGGKTVAYYANCARSETNKSDDYGNGEYDTTSPRAKEDDSADGTYRLTYLKSEDGSIAFTSEGVRTIEYAMNDMDWDIVIIQGHDVEQMYEGEHHKAFVENLNYLTNYIKSFDPSVEIGYYMTWQRNQEIDSNRIASYWTTMQETVEENSNVSFVIPVGTAVENARTTFLGNLNYKSTGSNFTKVDLLTGEPISGTMANDNNYGLQRDETHMSAVVGRFLAGYTIGKYLINHINSMIGTDFTGKEEISEIYSFDRDIGKLPELYVDAIKDSADTAIEKPYEKTELTAYDDPMTAIKTAVERAEYKFADLATDDAVKTAIEKKLESLDLTDGTQTTVEAVTRGDDGNFTAEVEVQFGYLSATVKIEGSCAEEQPEPEPEPTPDPDEPDVPDIPANPSYQITMPAAEGGSVTANPTAAKKGDTVTLTVTPEDGYQLADLTVTDFWGKDVALTKQADGTYTFTMPGSQVEIEAAFTQTGEPEPELPFTDVTEADWFYDEVYYVWANGLMNGVENNRFAPNTATNRAMLATILYRLAGQPDVSGEMPFTDVAAGTWYTDAVLWAAQNGIVNGLGENTFAPMNTLTREQLVTMLYRYAEAEGYDVSAAADLSGYPDADKVQTYAQGAMSWAVAEGIVAGMDDGTLNPAGNATRAQIATILMRFCEGVVK